MTTDDASISIHSGNQSFLDEDYAKAIAVGDGRFGLDFAYTPQLTVSTCSRESKTRESLLVVLHYRFGWGAIGNVTLWSKHHIRCNVPTPSSPHQV